MNHLERVLSLLDKRTGMDVTTLGGPSVVEKAMEQSRQDGGFTTLSEWLAVLEGSSEQWKAFLHLVVVGETFFFRYPESYEALTTWISQYPVRPLRILSLPCSTGEESYSIAISLLRAGLQAHEFSVLGLDINEHSVEQAREGSFHRSSSFRSSDILAYRGYLSVGKSAIHVEECVRRQVDFETKNFWDVIGQEESFDVIFCRNLLIYFSAERQAAALEKLGRWLKPEGLLFLGPAEVPVAGQKGWSSAEFPMAFACRKQEPRKEKTPAVVVPTLKWTAPKELAVPPVLKTRKPPLQMLLPVAAPAPTLEPGLPEIRQMADRGNLSEAKASLDMLMQKTPSDADCFALAGVLAEASGDKVVAEKMFRKALYLAPAHVEAVTHLAWLLQADGRLEASRKLLARADRIQSS